MVAPKRGDAAVQSGRLSIATLIVNEMIRRLESGEQFTLAGVTRHFLKLHRCPNPKRVDLVAAIPEKFRAKLLPLIRAKPVRTASGVAIVAVMCKPHRCRK